MTGVVNPKTGFTYDLPTQNEDGSPLAPTDIAKFQVGFGQVSGTYTLVKDDVTLEAGKQTSPLSLAGGLAFGQWFAALRTVSKDSITSAWSTEMAFELRAPTPKPPSNPLIA